MAAWTGPCVDDAATNSHLSIDIQKVNVHCINKPVNFEYMLWIESFTQAGEWNELQNERNSALHPAIYD